MVGSPKNNPADTPTCPDYSTLKGAKTDTHVYSDEEVIVPPSHLGDVKRSVSVRLRQMYIDMSCPRLGIGLDITDVHVGFMILDPNSGACMADVIFTLKHVIPIVGTRIHKPTGSTADLELATFDDTCEKIADRFEGEALQYEVTLCQYIDHSSQLPIDPSIRFVCIAKSVEHVEK